MPTFCLHRLGLREELVGCMVSFWQSWQKLREGLGTRGSEQDLSLHTCDKFQRGFREIFLSLGLWKIYRNIFHWHQGDFRILVKVVIFRKKKKRPISGSSLKIREVSHVWVWHLSRVMTKPVYAICEQQRHRWVCASAHSDQRLCCSLSR